MKRKGYKKSSFSIVGAVIFFLTIAIVIQIAILTYDYIIKRTQDKGLIALLILIVVLVLAAVCTVADYIRRKIMVDKPVERIMTATAKIASGDFSARVDTCHSYDKYDGYDLIAENINKMAEELGKSEVLKTDFIANVSHELKTPLAVIQSYSTALASSDIDEETRLGYCRTINTASRRLSNLVSNILKLNKLENQKIMPEYESVDLTSLLSDIIISYESVIDEKEIELVCELDDVRVVSVSSYLEIVFGNLISNALKFSDLGGRVEITLKKQNTGAVLRVADNGPGISAETGKKIFEKFYQGDTSHSSEGNGLGLALVKKVIDILGGEISVESEVGKGSAFTVALKNLEVVR